MPEEQVVERAKRDKEEGKSASTQAGEFVREEMHHIREGKHGARSSRQAIAIGLSKARRAGVDLPAPERGKTTDRTRRKAKRDYQRGHGAPPKQKATAKRSRSSMNALKREGKDAASHAALSRQAHAAARNRSAADRHAAAEKAVRTKGAAGRSAAAKKAARTRAAHNR